MKKAVLLTLFMLLSGCENPLGNLEQTADEFCAGLANKSDASSCQTLQNSEVAWDFSNSSDYSYNSDHIKVENSQAELLKVTTSFEGDLFNQGTRLGTRVQAGRLQLDPTSGLETALHSNWTPKYSKLVGHWKMDGDWLDASGKGKDATVVGDATFSTASQVGPQAGSFDGTGDSADTVSFVHDFSGGFTVGGWIRNEQAGIYTTAIRKRGSYLDFELTIDASNRFRCRFLNSTEAVDFTSSSKIETNAWVHAMCVFDPANERLVLYVNGNMIGSTDSAGALPPSESSRIELGQRTWQGQLDDMAVWETALSHEEVALIYHRQKQKYSGMYISPVVDMGASSAEWDGFTVGVEHVFHKELTSQSDDLNPSLMDDVIGIWHFNETVSDTYPAGADYGDSSGNDHHITKSAGTFTQGVLGVFQSGVNFGGAGTHAQMTNSGSLIPADLTGFSISLWIRPYTLATDGRVFTIPSNATDSAFAIAVGRSVGKISILARNSGGSLLERASSQNSDAHKYHHVVVTITDGLAVLYIDGVNRGELTNVSLANTIARTSGLPIRFGTSPAGVGTHYNGSIDEMATWKRVLSEEEVENLYLRGANRIKYQVRSCVDASCNCRALANNALSSSSDCDGDGISNSSDIDDAFSAEWKGPGGDGSTYYSELFNRDVVDMDFSCHSNSTDLNADVCINNEITLSGESYLETPDFNFSDMAASALPANNRYFQYRLIMEADDNLSLPELQQVRLLPADRYYGAGVIEATQSFAFTDIESLTFTEGGSCSLTYQLTPNGSDYYYWNGTKWTRATAALTAQSSSAATISEHIGKLSATSGSGSLSWRAFMNSDLTQNCEIKRIEMVRIMSESTSPSE